MGSDVAPAITGIHHFSITVTDLEASLGWYQRLFRADRVPMKFPHYGCEDTGYGELLIEPRSGVVIGLHTNTGNARQRASSDFIESSPSGVWRSCSPRIPRP